VGLLTACECIRELFPEEGLTGTSYPYPVVELALATPMRTNPVLHHYKPDEPPLIPTRISCKPESAGYGADYTAEHDAGIMPFRRNAKYGYGYECLKPGKYRLHVQFAGGGWTCTSRVEKVQPPVRCFCFEAYNV